MFTTMTRPYKERTAAETIDTIRAILEPLGLAPNEVYEANPYAEIFSSSIALPREKGGFRTNGNRNHRRTTDYGAFCISILANSNCTFY